MRDFKNQKVVITGGTSGIGLATAKKFIEGGAEVLVTGRNKQKLEKVKEELGSSIMVLQSDVSNLDDINKLRDKVSESWQKFDILFANAGVAINNSMGVTSEEFFSNTFNINVRGVFFCVEKLASLINDGGSIVLTGSIVGNKGMPDLSLYNASKAAVRSFSRSWANDLKSRNIRVNTVSPGVTETPIFKTGLDMSDEDINGFKDFLREASPIGRMGKPEEIADSVLFLSSGQASYINGIELSVDGGFAQV
ncbi:MAG: SDR family NAD(P)-dependent oxidoreductase [Bdellovibrionales bacterium]